MNAFVAWLRNEVQNGAPELAGNIRSDAFRGHFRLRKIAAKEMPTTSTNVVQHLRSRKSRRPLIAESFTGRLRYSGASLGYQLASVVAGGPAPLIATALFAHYHSGYAIAGYILVCAIASFVAAAMLHDYTNKDISREYDHGFAGT